MKRFNTYIQLILMAVLLLGGASMTVAVAAGAPQISSLGQIRDGFVSPTRLDVDGQGNLYVVDARNGKISKFDKYGSKSKGVNVFDAVVASGGGLAVTDDGALLFVAEQKSVAVLDGVSGLLLGYLGGQDRFGYVYDIDIDANGYVFVADAGNAIKVEVFRPEQSGAVPYVYEYQFGSKGIAAGQMMGLAAMDINAAAGEIYIADPVTHKPEGATTPVSYPKVQVYDLAGNLKKVQGGSTNFILLGSKAFGPKEASFFGGMTFDGQGRGYFADSFNGRVNVLNLQGANPLTMYLSAYATVGYGQGQLSDPRDVAYDPVTGRLFVLCGDGRVEIFGIDGATSPIKVNHPPAVPELINPIGQGEVSSATPTLSWNNSSDIDEDTVAYAVQILTAGEASVEYNGIAEGAGSSLLVVPSALQENAMYQWTAKATDGQVDSAWADSQSFYVNAVEENPSSPELTAPASGASVDGLTTFSWTPSVDPDPFDVVSYFIQVSDDAAFAAIAFEEILDGTETVLGDCTGYPTLEDGKGYFWRVKAVDSTGLESVVSKAAAFAFDTTTLKVTANMPGARVFLGGNLGFAGKFVGEAPVELRDFPAGVCSVVIERAGFEPFVAQVNVVERQGAKVAAVLVPAVVPDKLKAQQALKTGKSKMMVGFAAAPYFVDFDNDGTGDLLVGNAAGSLVLYRGASSGKSRYDVAVPIELPVMVPGATPVVVDWNNDYRKDLLLGAADGTLTLFLNTGTESEPLYPAGVLLTVAGEVLDAGSKSAPFVIDFDGDDAKDLVVGSASGVVAYYRNVGDDASPVLEFAGNLLELGDGVEVAPFFADWDGNGSRDLLVAANGQLFNFLRQDDGSFAQGEVIEVKQLNSADVAHFFVCDTDDKKGKDMFVGTVSGHLIPVRGNGKTLVPAFSEALLEKVAAIQETLGDEGSDHGELLSGIVSSIENGKLKAARKKTSALAKDLNYGKGAAMAQELKTILD